MEVEGWRDRESRMEGEGWRNGGSDMERDGEQHQNDFNTCGNNYSLHDLHTLYNRELQLPVVDKD